jgi:hypothetical protein
MKMGTALITVSIVFAIGGFICLYEENSQADEVAYLSAKVEAQAAEIKADEETIGTLGQ